ncbi:hypothetical protein SAMN05216302_106012 [Nitrosomonas aestuarii]|uniref:Uncharacterized protein n=1 Tax=Nitrosomonas aestuarii TaxID=52441 RepID=A0A1I4GPM0_9PROT|nr:hypothetical protein [Nitrosomonas aestuarii]SFL31978.1 hypothetical protein SAMN05216302_106012 [Nitrosomonas aestuarii]
MQDDFFITLLTGQLPFILIASAVLAMPLSWLLLWRYRKAVSKIMSERASQPTIQFQMQPEIRVKSISKSDNFLLDDASRLRLQFVDRERLSSKPENSLWLKSLKILQRAVCVHLFAGSVFALIMASVYLISGIEEIVAMQLIVMGTIFFWPVVLVFNQLTTTAFKRAFVNMMFYFAALLMLNSIVLMRNPHMGFADLFVVWATYNLPPTLVLVAFLNRHIRAVGPMVWVFIFAAITGSLLALGLVDASEMLLSVLTQLGATVSFEATGIFAFILVAGFVVFSIGGWLLLKRIGKVYASRIISDQSLVVDSVMLIFAIYYAINIAFEGPIWVLSGVAAFVAYNLIVRQGMKYVVHRSSPVMPLLVLRVFSLGNKSEALFQAITQRWRYLGNVQLIAGPDLATATIEPHEFLTFLSGRLKQEFIHDEKTLQQRLAALDTQKDFDGRFRINELFCYADTWKLALAELVKQQHTVLMDLRSFSTRKPGCIHELNTLVRVVPLHRILLVVDETTDMNFLFQVLQKAWQQCRGNGIADSVDGHAIRVCKLALSADPVKVLIPELCVVSQ